MNASIVLVVIGAGLVVSVFAGVRHYRAKPPSDIRREMRALAESEGWQYSEPAGGDVSYIVESDGWQLTGRFFRSANRATIKSNHQTEWRKRSEIVGAVMFGPKLPSFVAQMDLGSEKMQTFLRRLIGDQAALLAGATRMTDVGSEAFTRTFDVFGTDGDVAAEFIGDGTRWNELGQTLGTTPIAMVGNGEIRIVVHDKLRTQDQARAIIDTGRTLDLF